MAEHPIIAVLRAIKHEYYCMGRLDGCEGVAHDVAHLNWVPGIRGINMGGGKVPPPWLLYLCRSCHMKDHNSSDNLLQIMLGVVHMVEYVLKPRGLLIMYGEPNFEQSSKGDLLADDPLYRD